MKTYFLSIFTILFTLILLDALWLGVLSKRFYPAHIGHLLADSPKISPAVFFYIIYSLGLYIFVVMPSLQNGNDYFHVLLMGMFFGFITYAAYDLTNHATLKNWPLIVTIVDMAWGTVATGIVSVCSVFLTRYFK